ncbi:MULTISPECIES: HlyD family type I secretion periplasmic adaptor subunit [Asticcacaulis]|uniref:HlyD family type I secretion periplasmic adaptor subunit n=1 Tax=Asticcacaulis TaxID=76890 RepID=UPI001AE707E7|nr:MULTISPECIES: HlyD family type I secretion periplasmic adaptor subunit [Asticcacaulis]MBP2159796.1 HlyD family secretion protein [Asticcacaulis solisilvae]MDR6800841.1 HlyD family secretion protein [Asticcacaulis sp. BE141]
MSDNALVNADKTEIAVDPDGRLSVQDDPRRDIKNGIIFVAAFFFIFVGLAAIIRVDAAIYSHGSIVVSGSRQQVQHREGGVITAVKVREGDYVKQGQTLIELAGDNTEANALALKSEYIKLMITQARLLAEMKRASSFSEPVELKMFTGADRVLVENEMMTQRQAMALRYREVADQVTVLSKRRNQTQELIAGAQKQLQANERRKSLAGDELASVESLEARGYAPKTRVRQLQQSIAGMEADNAGLTADMRRNAASITELAAQENSIRSQAAAQIVQQLEQISSRLSEVAPGMTSATEQLGRTTVKATSTGRVVGLTVHNAGAVVTPGQVMLEIVPDDAPLIIEAMVDAKDGDDIRPQQEAQIRFSAIQERDLPIMKGKVLKISADTFQDQKTGVHFYKAQVEVSPQAVSEISKVRGMKDVLKPGLPVEIIVPLRKRTILGYLFEPLNQTFWRSFREH